MFSSKARLAKRTPENGINREQYIGHLTEEYYTTSSADAKEQVTANLANFAYDPLNYEYLTQHNVIVVFLDLLISGNEKLIEHGITGICNYSHDPQIRITLLEEKNIELIQNQLESNNSRILAPTITTLIFLQIDCDRPFITKEAINRVWELLKEVEAGEKPVILKNLLLILQDQFRLPEGTASS